MNKQEVKDFFDELAASWDEGMIRNEEVIQTILDNAGVQEGNKVLDVACGTGVLIEDYKKRNVKSITGIDLSEKMIEIASQKYKDVTFLCKDVEEFSGEYFDKIIVYNAFPHFENPDRLIKHLSTLLKENGTLTIAHGMSREKINEHHNGRAKNVSNGLMQSIELKEIMRKYLDVYVCIDSEQMYEVCGKNYSARGICL